MADPSVPSRRATRLEETVYVELVRTADLLSRGIVQVLKSEDLSLAQYNALRILGGASDGLPCGEIGERMITRDPDITRLLDRLEKRGLIARFRESQDRRRVRTRLLPEGIEVLQRLQQPVLQAHRRQLGHLGRERLQALVDLLLDAREAGK